MPQKMRVCNTKEYNDFLKRRGNTFSLYEQALEHWYHPTPSLKPGAPFIYSDELILIAHTIRFSLKLPLRQLQGHFESLLCQLLKDQRCVPDYTTFSRRLKSVHVDIHDYTSPETHLIEAVIDSSGICLYQMSGTHHKDYGKERAHVGYDKVRKIHVLMDLQKKVVLGIKMTSGTFADSKGACDLLEATPFPLKSLRADGAYDRRQTRLSCAARNITQIIPPTTRTPAIMSSPPSTPNLYADRNTAVRCINQYETYEDGMAAWKREVGYGKRAHVEAFFSRFKRIFGASFSSTNEINRAQEVRIKVRILNHYSSLPGRPSFCIAG